MRKKKEIVVPSEEMEIEDSQTNPLLEEDDLPPFYQEQVLRKIPPAKWESLLGILDFLTKESDDAVIIQNSVILYGYKGGSIIRANLHGIFDGESLNLHISSPKKWTRLFKILKDSKIYILEEENRFIVTNGQTKLFLPKQLNSYVGTLEFPNLEESEIVCDLYIQKEARDTILKLGKDSTYLEFLIKSNKLKCVNIPNTAIFIFPEYMKDEEIKDLNSSNADLTLRSQVFLPYAADTYKMVIGKNSITGSFFSYTLCNSSSISIEIYEQLENSTGIDQLF